MNSARTKPPGEVVGVGILRLAADGSLFATPIRTVAAVFVLTDGTVAWQPVDLSKLSAEQLRLFAERLRQQLDLVETEHRREARP